MLGAGRLVGGAPLAPRAPSGPPSTPRSSATSDSARSSASSARPLSARSASRPRSASAARVAASCQRACAATISAAASSSPAVSRVACCSASWPSRRACGRSSARMSSTRARFPSASVELLLGLAPPPLVAPDAGDLLEQRPPLLGAERQRLVDHALADEQERVLGEVRAVQQVDEVAQPHALAVEQVVVLARAVEAPAELDHAVLDRQQGVAVVEHERHVGHALGRRASRSPPRSRPRTCGSGAIAPARPAPSGARRRGSTCPSRWARRRR